MRRTEQAPLVLHLMHRFDTGGLENGVVNLINHMPAGAFRHMVVALTEVTDFRQRLNDPNVQCIALRKGPGHGFKLYPALWRLLRLHRPAIVHSRNLAALEMQVAAWAAGVPVRIHGEHGRDLDDLDGSSKPHQRLRRLYAPCVHRWVALSQDLEGYLTGRVGIPAPRITQIYNGVDDQRFVPAGSRPGSAWPEGFPFAGSDLWCIGTVGRMAGVKHQSLLARAFALACGRDAAFRSKSRLVMVGDGPERAESLAILEQAGVADLAWMPGERRDVPEVMRSLDCFVLPSLAEGISNTILEAMATGLPVVATDVGGNAELVEHGRTGLVVPSNQPEAMAEALLELAGDSARAASMALAGRQAVAQRFSLRAMVAAYQGLYERQLQAAGFAAKEL